MARIDAYFAMPRVTSHMGDTMDIKAFSLKDDGLIPNNPRLPVLIYRRAFAAEHHEDLAAIIERRFNDNRWQDSWRSGVYGFQHYHSMSHEVLGVSAGQATLQLGGAQGIVVEVAAGDVVGAYPTGTSSDMCYAIETERQNANKNIAGVPLPQNDPVFGEGGPLFHHWKT